MSSSQALAFLERLAADRDLQLKIGTATNSSQVIKFAKEAGFDFTIEEFRSTALRMPMPSLDELSDGELATVSGGDRSSAYSELINRIVNLPD